MWRAPATHSRKGVRLSSSRLGTKMSTDVEKVMPRGKAAAMRPDMRRKLSPLASELRASADASAAGSTRVRHAFLTKAVAIPMPRSKSAYGRAATASAIAGIREWREARRPSFEQLPFSEVIHLTFLFFFRGGRHFAPKTT